LQTVQIQALDIGYRIADEIEVEPVIAFHKLPHPDQQLIHRRTGRQRNQLRHPGLKSGNRLVDQPVGSRLHNIILIVEIFIERANPDTGTLSDLSSR